MPQGGVYNMWQGYLVTPVDPATDPEGKAALDIVFDHIHRSIAGGDDERFQYQLDWLSLCITQPWRTNMPGCAWVGREGSGKNIIVSNLLRPIFGQHLVMHADANRLISQFNSDLHLCTLYVCNEMTWGGLKDREGLLKSMLSDDTRTSERKYFDRITVRNFLKLLVFSNDDWFAPIGFQDRRWAVQDIVDLFPDKGDRSEKASYFAKLARACARAQGCFLFEMMHRTVDEDLMRQPPGWMSAAKQGAMLKTAGSVERFLYELLAGGEVQTRLPNIDHTPCVLTPDYQQIGLSQSTYGATLHEKEPRLVPTVTMFRTYQGWCAENGERYPESATAFQKKLLHLLDGAITRERGSNADEARRSFNGARPWLYRVAPLAEAREAYEAQSRVAIIWP